MSAMVTQISFENQQSQFSNNNESTEAETVDDLFEHYQREINIDTNLAEREQFEEEFDEPQLKGFLPTQIHVHETLDTSSNPILTLPAGLVENCKE